MLRQNDRAGWRFEEKSCRPSPAREVNSALRLLVVERDGVKLEPVIDQTITELPGDLRLQPFDLVRLELDHGAGAQIDEMIVMGVGNLFGACPALAKIMTFDEIGVFEQLDRAVDRGD